MNKQAAQPILMRAISVVTGLRSMVEDIEECDVCGRSVDLHQTIFLHGRFFCRGCANSALSPHPSPVAVAVDAHTHSIL